MTTAVDHSKASHKVASFRFVPNGMFNPTRVLLDSATHTLVFKSPWYDVRMSFTPIKDDSEHMWIRSTNWRAEDEPCGLVTTAKAREMYRELLNYGFKAA